MSAERLFSENHAVDGKPSTVPENNLKFLSMQASSVSYTGTALTS